MDANVTELGGGGHTSAQGTLIGSGGANKGSGFQKSAVHDKAVKRGSGRPKGVGGPGHGSDGSCGQDTSAIVRVRCADEDVCIDVDAVMESGPPATLRE